MHTRIPAPSLLIVLLAGLCLWTACHIRSFTMPEKPKIFISQADRFLSKLDPTFTGYKLLFELHHMGDLEGQRTPVSEYDIEKVLVVLVYIDQLLPHTELTALLAASYYGHSTHQGTLTSIALYLNAYSQHDLLQRWPWLVRALHITCKRLGSIALSKQLARPLKDMNLNKKDQWVKEIPGWLTPENCLKQDQPLS